GLGVDLQLLSNREKTLLIDALKEHYDLPELLGQLGLARSSYFVSDQPYHLEQSRDISQDRVHVNHRGHHAQRFRDTEICDAAYP
ncbi:hypothetical protein NFX52_30750, partial [Acidovorax facilis]|nr:hypothetical protein [Acidovorax facilis]